MNLVVQQTKGLKGEIRVPGDKSISHRAVILGSIAKGTTWVRGFLSSEDCLQTVRAFRQMGVDIRNHPDGLEIKGRGQAGLSEPADVLDLGNSGTSLRLLAGLLAGQRFFTVLTGDASLRRRPMRRVVEPLTQMGARILGRQGGDLAPLSITGQSLRGMAYDLPVASAQVKSALLLAGLNADSPTTLTEPLSSRDHTERMLRAFGADLQHADNKITLNPPTVLEACEIEVPGDFSSAVFFVVGALILLDSELLIRGVGVNPTRLGAIEILEKMGGDIRFENHRDISGEPIADIRVRSSRLKGITINPEWVPRAIDEFPVLAVAAAYAEGETVIQGAGELRVKESDRIATMAAELRKLGAKVEEQSDGLRIQGGHPLRGAVTQSHGDHRVAMALAVAGLGASGETVITDTECIETSFPGFESLMIHAGAVRPEPKRNQGPVIAIDGPAGSGKSSAARELARRLGFLYVDTGALYRAVGWKALQAGINIKSRTAIGQMIRGLHLEVKPAPNRLHVLIDGKDITDQLRSLEVSRAAAAVAMIPSVRKRLLTVQRKFGREGKVVVEGRDIGTVVFPKADLKVFLEASAEVRVKRRWKELRDKGMSMDLQATQEEIDIRDLKDSRRSLAPLKKAEDAISINSTDMTLEEVVDRIQTEADQKLGAFRGE